MLQKRKDVEMNNPLIKCSPSLSKILLSGLSIGLLLLQAPAHADDYTSLNKRVNVDSGVTTNEISSVNGKIFVDDNVSAEEISSVNGKVSIGDGVNAGEVSTVNGKIEIGNNVSVKSSVHAVNGKIEIGAGGDIGENVSTVNGTVELSGVTVGNRVKTVNGSIYLADGTLVKGDIIIGGPNSNKGWKNSWNGKRPKLVIDASSTVEGKIIVYRKVEYDFVDSSLMNKVEDRSGEK